MHENDASSILVPAPTPWPFIASLGITLMFSGIVTHIAVTMVGTVVLLRAAIGWWFDVLPEQKEDAVSVSAGRLGAARPLNDPMYLAVIGKERMRDVIAKGVSGTAMPAFAQNGGGTLTDQQITILADQIDARWTRPQDYAGVTLPPYSAELGDARAGEAVFKTYCSRCHGDNGTGGASRGSVIEPALLSLESNQSIRTTVIAGRADLGSPNWKSDSPGHAMTPQEISDVVAWLAGHRTLAITSLTKGTVDHE